MGGCFGWGQSLPCPLEVAQGSPSQGGSWFGHSLPWLTTRGQFGTQTSPVPEAGGEKDKGEPCPVIIDLHETRSQTPLLPSPCKGKKGRINDHSSGSLLHTHMQGVPTLGCLGCSEKQSMCCSIIPGTGRWARRCWSRPGPQSTAQPFSKAPTLSPLFYKQRQQHSPGCGISPAPALPWGWSPARLASDSASAPSLGSCICISYTAAAFAIRDSRGCSPGAAAGTTEKQRNK